MIHEFIALVLTVAMIVYYLPTVFLCLALSGHLLWHLTRAKGPAPTGEELRAWMDSKGYDE